jgi:hypothetical protein
MLTIALSLTLTLVPCPSSLGLIAAQVDDSGRGASSPSFTEAEAPRADQAGRSAALFSEPRVGVGVLIGRMGMGLLFGGITVSASTVVLVALAYAGATAGVLVPGVMLTAASTGLATALGVAMFGANYGRDFLDALVVSMVTAAVGGLLFLVGFFVPALMAPMLIIAGALMVVETPLVVQGLKGRDEAPEPTLAMLRF